MKIPKMLEDYLDETEQHAEEMPLSALFEEAKLVLSQHNCGDYYAGEYSSREVASLKSFITRISSKMIGR